MPATRSSAANEVLKLRLTPSGVLYPHITSVIGNGVVVNPVTLIGELDMLASRGIDVSRVRVSRSAHVTMPYHVALDVANEARLGGAKVGTTGRGIGPTYGDRAWRLGLRMEDLLDPAVLRERIERALPDKNLMLGGMGAPGFEVEPLVEQALGWGVRLRDHLDDTTWLVQAALARGEHVLLEGAQGDAPRPRSRELPIRDVVEPGRRRGMHGGRDRSAPGRRSDRRHEGVFDARRFRAVPDRTPR